MTYDDWKLETPEDEEYRRNRFLRKLYRQRDPDEEREAIADYREECKADWQRTGGDDD